MFQTHVQANLYGMFRDNQFFPEPEVFKPERWLKEYQMDKELKALSNLVWGHGARMCIGMRMINIKLPFSKKMSNNTFDLINISTCILL